MIHVAPIRHRRSTDVLRAMALATALLALPCPAAAQDADLVSASVRTCNVRGTVTVTLLGLTTTWPVTCLNPTTQSAPGEDESALVDTTVVGVPVVANVATVGAPFGGSSWVDAPSTTTLTGDAGAATVNLVQDVVRTSDVRGRLACTMTTGSDTVTCRGGTAIGSLIINGQPVAIPAEPIPFNHTIAVANVPVRVTLAGLPLLSVQLSGRIVLNQVTITGLGTTVVSIEHAPIHADLTGSIVVAGLGPLTVSIRVTDLLDGALNNADILDHIELLNTNINSDPVCCRERLSYHVARYSLRGRE